MGTKLNNAQNRFIILFIGLFVLFYYFNIGFWSLVSPKGNHYNSYIAQHLDYIGGLRDLLILITVGILKLLGYHALNNLDQIMVPGHGIIRIAYDCIGMAVMSLFTAFAVTYPKPLKTKLIFLVTGILTIQTLNVCRLVLLALYWGNNKNKLIDHHLIFNIVIYIIIGIAIYFYTKSQYTTNPNAAN